MKTILSLEHLALCLILLVFGCLLIFVSPVLADYTQSEQVTITLNYGGQIQGVIDGVTDGDHIYWKGIPYAACPTGNNRFRGPQPVTSWDGVLQATEYSKKCHAGLKDDSETDEDCLYLNVFAPKTRSSESTKVPVIVYIHGGGYKQGSADYFNGKWFVEDGYDGAPVILVTMNYRLGVFGFLYHPDIVNDEQIDTQEATLTKTDDSRGNWGIRDQIKALEWVQENIDKFGGDPNNVTIMGESAGCWSVYTHLTSPLSAGLFHKAICHSQGPAVNSNEHAVILGNQLLGPDYMDCADAPSPIQCMRDASVDDYVYQHQKEENQNDYQWYMGNVDGKLMPGHPYDILEDHQQHKVPLLIGYNEDEVPPIYMTKISNSSSEDYDTAISSLFHDVWNEIDDEYTAADVEYDIQRFKNYYSKSNWGTYKKALARYQTDLFACQEIEAARLHVADVSDVYMYYWHWPGYIDNLLPALHAAELRFLFQKPSWLMPLQRKMADNMIRMWSKFAYDGDPWDDDWNTIFYEKEWKPFTTTNYEIYELGARWEMRTREPGAAIPQSDPNITCEACDILMNVGKGHFRYRWGGMKQTDSQRGVELQVWIDEIQQDFYGE